MNKTKIALTILKNKRARHMAFKALENETVRNYRERVRQLNARWVCFGEPAQSDENRAIREARRAGSTAAMAATVASATPAPADRSIAPVRMISSWPVARIATTLTIANGPIHTMAWLRPP